VGSSDEVPVERDGLEQPRGSWFRPVRPVPHPGVVV